MSSSAGFAVLADEAGTVLAVLRDEQGILGPSPEGSLLAARLAPDSVGPFLDMLVELRGAGAAFDRELVVRGTEGPAAFHFVAARLGVQAVVVAGAAREGIFALFEDLARANGELVNQLRSGAKERGEPRAGFQEGQEGGFSQEAWEEVSRLNNELVNSRRELTRANGELQRLDALKNRFLGMAAHDLRNPIAAIAAYADYLLDPPALPEGEIRHALESIKRRAEFMQALVEDLLDTAAIESGALRLHEEAVDLSAVLEEAVETLKPAAAKRDIRLELRAAAGLSVCADPVRLAQAVGNLLSNAVKFSPRGSTVSAEVIAEEREALVRVRDRGQGMDEEQLRALGTPFGSPTARTPDGDKTSGLGVLIARRIAEAHGGRILYRSVPGEGTTAELRIPSLAVKGCTE